MGSLSARDAPAASFAALSTLHRTSDLPPKGTGGYCLPRIRRACLDYARWPCERHVTSYSAGIAAHGLSRSMPRPGTLRNMPTSEEGTFRRTPMQFQPTATFDGSDLALFYPVAPHSSYAKELNDGPLHHTVLLSLAGLAWNQPSTLLSAATRRTRQPRLRIAPNVYGNVQSRDPSRS